MPIRLVFTDHCEKYTICIFFSFFLFVENEHTRYPSVNVFAVVKNQYTLLTHYTPDLTKFISKEPTSFVNDKLE